jgi:hypothetical protein
MALLAVSPPLPAALELAARLGAQSLGDIPSQGGMAVAVLALGSTAAAVSCARQILAEPATESCALGLHLGEVALGAGGNGAKPNAERESVRITTGLGQQADEGSALLSQAFYEIARGEAELPANYLGPRQIRLVPRTVPVFKLNLGDERANRKTVVSKQMDMILLEERQRNQAQRERRRKQAKVLGAACFIIFAGGFGLMIARMAATGKLDRVISLIESNASGDPHVNLGRPQPPADSPSPAPAASGAFQPWLQGREFDAATAQASFCQLLRHLADSAANFQPPSAELERLLAASSRPEAERRLIIEHLVEELSHANAAGALSPANLDRLKRGHPPEGYTVVQLLPTDRFPRVATSPVNFALLSAAEQRNSQLTAVELLEDLRKAGLAP